jgi:hypothetical protein
MQFEFLSTLSNHNIVLASKAPIPLICDLESSLLDLLIWFMDLLMLDKLFIAVVLLTKQTSIQPCWLKILAV